MITIPESHQGQLLAYLQLRRNWEQFQQQCTLWAFTTGSRGHKGTQPQVNSSNGGRFSGWPPSGSGPISLTSHCRPQSQLSNRSGGPYCNNQGAYPAPDQAATTGEQRWGPTQWLGQALSNTAPIKLPIKGVTAQASGLTSPTSGQTLSARATKILQLVERSPQTQKVWRNEMTKKYVSDKGAR